MYQTSQGQVQYNQPPPVQYIAPPPPQNIVLQIPQQGIQQQIPQQQGIQPGENHGNWKYPLCSCCEDCKACCLTCWCPCISAGEIMEKGLGESFISGVLTWIGLYIIAPSFGCPIGCCVYPLIFTQRLRERRQIDGNYCKDCLSITFCQLCQMTRELREVREVLI